MSTYTTSFSLEQANSTYTSIHWTAVSSPAVMTPAINPASPATQATVPPLAQTVNANADANADGANTVLRVVATFRRAFGAFLTRVRRRA
ncbi:hypothetical protein B0H17DRAFT_1199666 [Mycena rosella]|uniref:Uncharacterized protein n=1 Tax=Mycena rosella TaxID=1033263 RepID=A0AAD7GLJ8_MYCRO|nr:hypothetical protein B0H17DRAFT_1199666 [Mycena rosella]